MTNPTLLVMAAGIGSRYGGLKQVDPVGPGGEVILDYSVYDALRAGFGRVVFLIRRDIEDTFREKVGHHVEQRVDTDYVFQELGDVPAGATVPLERKKPWGTGHAVLSCQRAVNTPFAAINADDFYGATAFQMLANHLRQAQDQADAYDYCLVGYAVGNTLSDHGHVARGVCTMSPAGELLDVRERTRIERRPEGVQYTENGADWVTLAPDTTVSLNTWGFTLSIFAELQARFATFMQPPADRLLTAEYFLPDVVGALIKEHKARVKVLPTRDRWYGVTYPADRTYVKAAVQDLIARGHYPASLWAA